MEAGAMIGTQQHLSALADECITAVAEHRGGGQADLHAGIDLGPVQTRVGAAPRVATQAIRHKASRIADDAEKAAFIRRFHCLETACTGGQLDYQSLDRKSTRL